MECKVLTSKKKSYFLIVLIETYWNVKLFFEIYQQGVLSCINRNILECKGVCGVVKIVWITSINRNILECKDSTGWAVCQLPFVLIETYWNVKRAGTNTPAARQVLIETYWNVKILFLLIFHTVPGINRNILECKGFLEIENFSLVSSINRNILECKVSNCRH